MHNIGEKVIKFCAFLFFLLCVYMAITSILRGSMDAKTMGALFGLFKGLIWGLAAGIIFVFLFLGRFSEGFTNFLFGGREMLQETPVTLSHARGFIASGEYEEAALLLQELYAQYPDLPDLNLLIFEFYLDNCNKKELAHSFAGNYLSKASIKSSDNTIILMRYCDLCLEKGSSREEMSDFLIDQATSGIYPEADKKTIFERVKGLNS